MELLLILAVFLILFFRYIFRSKDSTETSGEEEMSLREIRQSIKTKEPRDFLKLASDWLNSPRPLKEMLEQEKSYVIEKLTNFLSTGGTYDRKYAAFALGQIGEVSTIEPLEKQLSVEAVEGVRDAIKAALTALRVAPVSKGASELDRRTIIEEVYWNKRPPSISL
jgi:hypothetical protein